MEQENETAASGKEPQITEETPSKRRRRPTKCLVAFISDKTTEVVENIFSSLAPDNQHLCEGDIKSDARVLLMYNRQIEEAIVIVTATEIDPLLPSSHDVSGKIEMFRQNYDELLSCGWESVEQCSKICKQDPSIIAAIVAQAAQKEKTPTDPHGSVQKKRGRPRLNPAAATPELSQPPPRSKPRLDFDRPESGNIDFTPMFSSALTDSLRRSMLGPTAGVEISQPQPSDNHAASDHLQQQPQSNYEEPPSLPNDYYNLHANSLYQPLAHYQPPQAINPTPELLPIGGFQEPRPPVQLADLPQQPAIEPVTETSAALEEDAETIDGNQLLDQYDPEAVIDCDALVKEIERKLKDTGKTRREAVQILQEMIIIYKGGSPATMVEMPYTTGEVKMEKDKLLSIIHQFPVPKTKSSNRSKIAAAKQVFRAICSKEYIRDHCGGAGGVNTKPGCDPKFINACKSFITERYGAIEQEGRSGGYPKDTSFVGIWNKLSKQLQAIHDYNTNPEKKEKHKKVCRENYQKKAANKKAIAEQQVASS